MDKWDYYVSAVGAVGIADGTYLTINSLFPKVPLECPTKGIINCGLVTTSAYSHIFGIPVALLGLLWFVAITCLSLFRPSFYPYLLFPLWAAGIAMVAYLISVELLILHAICLYCTLAHTCAVLMGAPVIILSFKD